MISLGPLLKCPFQVRIGEPAQAGNLPNPLCIRAMTNNAGHNIGIRHAFLIDRFSRSQELGDTIAGRFGGQRRKICRQIARGSGIQVLRGAPHILLREWIVAPVGAKSCKLILEILRPLSGQSGRRRIALRRRAMAPGAIPGRRALCMTRHRGNGKATEYDDRHSGAHAFHGLNSARLAFVGDELSIIATYFR
jgi:hypothetical protein